MFMTFNEVINLIKESGVKEYIHITYNDRSWKIKFQQLGGGNNYIIFCGKYCLENIYIVPSEQLKNYDKHVLESIIKGDDYDDYDDITHIKMAYILDDSEEDIIKDE